jgi:hypothetical protein
MILQAISPNQTILDPFRSGPNSPHWGIGHLAAVMKTMGHRDVKTAMQYQHPELESVRLVINDRNSRHNSRHKTEFLQ